MIGRHPDFWMPVFCALRPKAPIYKLPAYWYDRKETAAVRNGPPFCLFQTAAGNKRKGTKRP